MKSNLIKYLFFIIAIALIIISIYILYIDGSPKTYASEEQIKKIEMLNEINIGTIKCNEINPILNNNRDLNYIFKLVFYPLLDITKDFRIENKLAQEFSKINSTTYIIKLRENIYWHDKTKFTAQDVIFTINALKNNNIESVYKENVKQIEKVDKIDDYTLKIFLNEEVPFFEYKMCFPILCSTSYDEDTLESKTNLPNGTGNYRIEAVEKNLIKMVSENEDNKSNIKRINVIIKENEKELYNSFMKGEIDYFITENVNYDYYLGTMGYNVTQIENRQYDYLVLNNKNRTLSNKQLRQAIEYAINKNSLNYEVFNNKYSICNFPLYYESFFSNNNKENNYNSSITKSLLIENGWNFSNNKWTNKNQILKFNLVVNKENENRVAVAENIKSQLEKIGIPINIIKVNNSSYKMYLKNKNYDMIITGNVVSNAPNLETYFGDNNLSEFENENIKDILKDVKNIENDELIKEKYSEIEKIYKEEVPFISLYANSLFIITNKNLKGNLSCNWFNLFYNIDNWYKEK